MAPQIPEKMTACQVIEYNKPHQNRQIPTPKPSDLGPHDLLVKTAVASLCHTDFMVQSGDMIPLGSSVPCTASHEGAGTVVAMGKEVTGYQEGDRVMVGLMFHPCKECRDCTGPDEDLRQYCQKSEGFVGVTRDGAFAEYLVCDSRISAKLPDAVSFETAAPMACAGSTIWRAIKIADLKAGQWIALVGSGGGLGHLGVQFTKALGLKVLGIDARDEGLALTKKAGADVVIDARDGKEKVVEQVQKVTGGEGVDAAIAISDAKDAAGLACAVTRIHGKMIQVAQPPDVIIPFRELVFRDIRIQGSLICSPQDSREMLDFVAKHKITVEANPFNGLDEIHKLIELAESGKMSGKGVVIVDPEQVEAQKKAGVELA